MDSGPADLLLGCLSARVEPAFSEQVGRSSPNDWNEVVDMAAHHGIAPLLFKRLKERDARARVPTDAWERLRLAYFANARKNTRLYRELRTVLRYVRNSGIPVIVLKGAYLAEAVYGDVALRPMGDVDLMVPRAELPRAQAILLDMGYGCSKECGDIELRCRRRMELAHLVRGDSDIELHWSIADPTSPFRIDIADLWKRARPVTIAGWQVLALSSEDLLPYLCLHASHHHGLGQGLLHFCDIAEAIRYHSGEMDWVQVVHSAREWRASRYVGLALHLTQVMLGAEVPNDILEQLVPGRVDQRMLETAREFVLARTRYERWVPLFDPNRPKSIGDKAESFRKRVFLSRGEMAARYSASHDSKRLWFYYALRIKDGIRTFGDYSLRRCRLMMRTLGRDPEVSLDNWLRSGKS